MQDGEYHLHGGNSGLVVDAHRNAAAVVRYRNRVVRIDDHLDGIAVTGQRLVHRIVNDLIYQVMKPSAGGRSDVHTRPFPDCLQTFQNLNLIRTIFVVALCIFRTKCTHIFLHSYIRKNRSDSIFPENNQKIRHRKTLQREIKRFSLAEAAVFASFFPSVGFLKTKNVHKNSVSV